MKKIIILLLAILCLNLQSFSQVLESDSLALVALYNATNGPNWDNNDYWLSEEIPASFWHGVHVNDGNVTIIELCHNNLIGELPPEFFNLTSLTEITLCGNPELTGQLYSSIGDFVQLYGININGTAIGGAIPPEIGSCTNLHSFHAEGCNFSGTFPIEMCNLPLTDGNFTNNLLEPNCNVLECFNEKNVDFHVDPWLVQKNGTSLYKACGLIPPFTPVAQQDSLALVAIYEATNGDNWTNNDSWLEYPVSLWYGVFVNDGRVRELNLGWNNLNGTIPPDIYNLDGCWSIHIGGDNVNGELLPEIENLTTLNDLRIHSKGFTGTIPAEIANLPNLQNLWFSGSGFSGELPSELCNSALQNVDFSYNNFEVGDCSTIQCLKDNGVQFHGDAWQRQESGLSLFEACGILPPFEPVLEQDSLALVQLYIATNGDNWHNNENWLSAEMPVAFWHGVYVQDERVRNLELCGNNLDGNIPIEFYDLTGIQHITFCANNLSGEILPEIGNLSELNYLDLNSNHFSGEIPPEIGNCTNLWGFHIEESDLEGIVPTELCNTQIQDINLQNNNLDATNSCAAIDCLKNNGVNFHGDAAQTQQSGLSLFLECGILPPFEPVLEQDSLALIQLYIATNGNNWNNNENWLSQEMPVAFWHGIYVENGRVRNLELCHNNLNGTIPIEFYNLDGLRYFSFCGQNISGQVMANIGNFPELSGFSIHDTQMDGIISSDISTLANLNWFDISWNQFSGSIPAGICETPLNEVNFERNNFDATNCDGIQCLSDGNIRIFGDQWQTQNNETSLFSECSILPPFEQVSTQDSLALEALYIATNGDNWHNNEHWLTDMPVAFWHGVEVWNGRVASLNLNWNNLEGELPLEFYSLTGLQAVYFGGNNLFGQLLGDIENLVDLYFLDLNENNLNGNIPPQIGNCQMLRHLYLRNNNLTGIIPSELCDIPLEDVFLDGNNFDAVNSCVAIQCLNDNGVQFHGDPLQTQQSGLSLFAECGIFPPFESVPAQDSIALVRLYEATNGVNWNRQQYWMSNFPVNFWEGVYVEEGRVRNLELGWNNLDGTIPEEFYDLTGIRWVQMPDNNLHGLLSANIGNFTELEFLNLNVNQLEGEVPSTIGNCSTLFSLHLQHNNFTFLPLEVCSLPFNEANFEGNYFDLQSCETFQCLIDNGVNLEGDPSQRQKNGMEFPAYCNPNINRSLLITEARLGNMYDAYVEITNISADPVQLNEFEFGCIRPWADPWNPEPNRYFMLPEHMLAPGESYNIAVVTDFGPEQWLSDPDNYLERQTKEEWYDLADIQFHIPEVNGDETDSIIGDHHLTFEVYNGRDTWYLRHHINETESVVIDQVGGVFDNNGRNQPFDGGGGYDVAGYPQATRTATLVRKANVLAGNLDFANGRGIGQDDSEWIAIPHLNADAEPWRDVFWTAGNHGDYNLEQTTLVSNTLSVDWNNMTITAPWGTRGLDDFMNEFDQTPGLAWHYHLSETAEDSSYLSARTGDRLTVYACGYDMDVATFDIIVLPPTNEDNIVVPKYRLGPDEEYFFGFGPNVQAGQVDWPRVTHNAPVIDTITGSHFGLPFATRTDTLIKYLEIPSNASYEFVFNGGQLKADLSTGDILRVTAENGTSKDYYIQVQPYRYAHVAELSAITWPDIPEDLKGTDGWIGDTIPGFNTSLFEYRITIPYEVVGVPVFLPTPADTKAKITTDIITPLSGNPENKTIIFTVTAEDGLTIREYRIQINKEKDPVNVQPYGAEPFLSEFIFWEQWSNAFAEICNPGTEPLDLSDYMFVMEWNPNPNEVIAEPNAFNWSERYEKYIPGYKWGDEASWQSEQYIAQPDPAVNPIVAPGDVFVMGDIRATNQTTPGWIPDYVWPPTFEMDVQFNNHYGNLVFENPWGEPIGDGGSPVRKWMNSNWYMFKILNEDVKNGLKPATDPNDFELIEAWGMADGSQWVIGGEPARMISNWMRKPEYRQGNPVWEGSFGTNPEDCEWTWTNQAYWNALNARWPLNILNITNDLGKHTFYEVTDHQSIIYSNYYNVSPGYSLNETISGVQIGTTSADFLSLIIKANEGQTLTITGLVDDSFAGGEILEVVSADGTNTTRYLIEATTEGLSDDAILTSEVFDITILADTSEITGFDFDYLLKEVVDSVIVPAGATMLIFDENNNLIPFERLNRQGQEVDVTVNAKTYFVVTAEDKQTVVVYRLDPDFPLEEIVATSELFYVNNEDSVISSIEPSTTVAELLANIYVEEGATAIVIDKYGVERTHGEIYPDDQVVIIYNWDAYYDLKAGDEDPRTYKVYDIYMCETLPVAKAKNITVDLNENGYASITLEDIDNGSVNECGESWLILSKTEFDCSNIGVNTVTLQMRNDRGGIAAAKAKVYVVDNTPPIVNVEDFSDTDPDGNYVPFTDSWDYIEILPDVCGIQSVENDAPDVFPVGTTIVHWIVKDNGGNVIEVDQSITLSNYAPVITEISAPIDPVAITNPVFVTGYFEDNNLQAAEWDWDDGSTSTVTIGNNIQGEHYYDNPGVYEITLTVTDSYGASATLDYRYVVVYDPEGGFVTGGGWIVSLPGALIDNSDAVGKAEFGFVAKYKKGATVPEGTTEFKFETGGLSFVSTQYDWLTIAGSKAMFKGIGTINGEGEYYFMISAIDGDIKLKGDPDMFRIKIWDAQTETVVYDNQMGAEIDENPMTEIGGGSIVIHDPKLEKLKSDNSMGDQGLEGEEEFVVYPNPTSGRVKISGFRESTEYVIKLVDMTGKCVVTKINNSVETEIDIRHLPASIYNLLIIKENEVFRYNIIKL